MKGVCNLLQGLKPVVLMVFVQIAYAAVNIIYKLAINDGMSMRVATAYRLTFASAFTIPVALIFDRKKRPNITWKVLFMAFLSGLFGGSLFLNLYAEGLALTSATFMLAILNLITGITFIMATSSGSEKLNWGVAEGKAKVIGTIIGISGAMLLTFYKGAEINIWSSNINLLHPHQNQNGHMEPQHADFSNKLLGVPCAIGSCCSFSLWLIIQAKMNEEYPSYHSSSALMSTMGAIQAIVLALCVDRDWTQWKLGCNIRLLTVAYSGIVTSGIVVTVISWCIKMRGPLFASIFNPLQLLLVAISAYLLLDEKLYLGSVLGAVLIACGLYAVLWDSAKPVLYMIVVESLYALVNIMLKMVLNDGMSSSVLVAYRFIFSTAFTVPFALLFERKSLHSLTGKVLFQAFLCGLFGGSLQQNLYIKSLSLVSATYTATMLNLIPAITYIMAVSLRLEKPNLGTLAGKTKLLGTLIGIGGAMILTLYKGKRIFTWSTHIDLSQHMASPPHGAATGSHLWGLMLALGTSLCFSLWLIIQTKMAENFPWPYSIGALTSIISVIQSILFALCTERDWSQWKLDWNLRLLAATSSGILTSGVCFTLISWCIHLKGPLFVSAFNPLMLVLVALVGSFILDDYITVGSLIGATLIVCGLYMLLWGKSKETRKLDSEVGSKKEHIQCDSIHSVNSSLACNKMEHHKEISTSVVPDTLSTVNSNL